MCRSIKTLRPPYAIGVTDEDVRAAALQYVQTVSGFRLPSGPAAAAFEQAVADITRVTQDLLVALDASVPGAVALAQPASDALAAGGPASQPRDRQERLTAAPWSGRA